MLQKRIADAGIVDLIDVLFLNARADGIEVLRRGDSVDHGDVRREAGIDHEKCVSCGACRNACPFGAIDERSNIIRVIREIQQGKQVIALVAPSIVGQYGL